MVIWWELPSGQVMWRLCDCQLRLDDNKSCGTSEMHCIAVFMIPEAPIEPLWLYDIYDMLNGHAEFQSFLENGWLHKHFYAMLMMVEHPSVIIDGTLKSPPWNGSAAHVSLFGITKSLIETQDIQPFARSVSLPRPLDPWLSMWWTSQSATGTGEVGS